MNICSTCSAYTIRILAIYTVLDSPRGNEGSGHDRPTEERSKRAELVDVIRRVAPSTQEVLGPEDMSGRWKMVRLVPANDGRQTNTTGSTVGTVGFGEEARMS